MELFAKKSRNSDVVSKLQNTDQETPPSSSSSLALPKSTSTSFKELGLCNWIQNATSVMSFKRPTPIQLSCIPAILNGRNVMGCAVTGIIFKQH